MEARAGQSGGRGVARVDTDLGDLSAMESGEATPSFGALLRQHRLNRGLTQAALAERAGLSERAIQHLERGRGQPYHETAQRLADALALTPGQRAAFDVAAAPAPRHRRKRQPSELPGSETPPSGEA